ncbi:integrase_H2C2 domain-containing protein [Nephila pilipes]|uniref:Integrase_H2C2 domain-containing protein n=1 Tax=Nephila pilipes TaxID=299642 RepID=A0A8X6QU79_NEPPI|nr:integrase_H2C2 domain-containing protein [Nephila pilipes]
MSDPCVGKNLLTRGVFARSSKSKNFWWSGPPCLKSSQFDRPQQKFKVPNEILQERRVIVNTVQNDPVINASGFSCLAKLLRVIANGFFFIILLGDPKEETIREVSWWLQKSMVQRFSG